MVRRDFLHRTLAGAASLAPLGAERKSQELVYQVTGFTCITCAVGLETLLSRQKGVIHAEAAYPSGVVKVEFDPALLNDNSVRALIGEMGFRVADRRGR